MFLVPQGTEMTERPGEGRDFAHFATVLRNMKA
jgi:hypothetical protein